MGNTIAYPMIGLGLSTAAMTSGFNQAEAIVKGGMEKVAGAVTSNPIKPMFDTSALTKGLEQALEKVERLRGKSVDLIAGMNAAARMNVGGSLVNSQFAGMVGASPGASRGPDAFLSGMSKAVEEAAKAAKAFSAFDGALALAKKSGGGIDSLIAGMSSAARLNVGGSAVNSQFAGMLGSTKAQGKLAPDFFSGKMGEWQKFDAELKKSFFTKLWESAQSGVSYLSSKASAGGNGFNLPNIGFAAIAVNQGLELVGKVQSLLSAPMRAGLKAEESNADVMAGGLQLIQSGTLTGTLARFSDQVDGMFASIWDTVNKTFDIQGWIETFRGNVAGVTAIIQGMFGTASDAVQDPKRLMESFQKGANFIIDTFDSVGKISIKIYGSFEKIIDLLRSGPGGEKIFGARRFNAADQQEIDNWLKRFPKISEKATGVLGFGKVDQVRDSTVNDAVEFLSKSGKLTFGSATKDMENELGDAVDLMKKSFANVAFGDVGKKSAIDAAKTLDDFTASLRKTHDPLYSLQKAADDDQKAIADMINKMGVDVDHLAVFLAEEAAAAAQGGRVQNFLNQALSQQKAASISTAAETGSQALADAVGRAMAGPGGKDIQGQIKDAIDAQLKETQDQTRVLNEMNDNWKRFKPGQVPQARGI